MGHEPNQKKNYSVIIFRALAALTAKDEQINQLSEEFSNLREKLFNQSLCRENRLENRLDSASDKIQKLQNQIQSIRVAKENAVNDKLDIQTSQRATQERLAHAEARISVAGFIFFHTLKIFQMIFVKNSKFSKNSKIFKKFKTFKIFQK